MCRPASFVATKDKVFWSENSDSHEDIIQEHKLHEGIGPNFVRVEIAPSDDDMSRPLDQWKYCLDQDVRPEWYDAEDVEARCRAELQRWYSAKVFTCGRHEARTGRRYACGSATVEACGSATVNNYGRGVITLDDGSNAVLIDRTGPRPVCTVAKALGEA
jgi:hypothetical protein